MLRTTRIRRQAYAVVGLMTALGCGGDAGAEHKDMRRNAGVAYQEALAAIKARDYPTAEAKLSTALEGGLNADDYCGAVAKRALCWAVAGKTTEALAELERIGTTGSNPDEVLVIQSFVLKKQGKTAPARDALTKAKRFNPRVQEIKG